MEKKHDDPFDSEFTPGIYRVVAVAATLAKAAVAGKVRNVASTPSDTALI